MILELCGILDNTTEASAGVITINIPESDFTGDSCTILDALHNFGNVRCSCGRTSAEADSVRNARRMLIAAEKKNFLP